MFFNLKWVRINKFQYDSINAYSFLNKVLGSAKGVIVPHQLVKSIGDIMIISRAAVPSYSDEEGKEK